MSLGSKMLERGRKIFGTKSPHRKRTAPEKVIAKETSTAPSQPPKDRADLDRANLLIEGSREVTEGSKTSTTFLFLDNERVVKNTEMIANIKAETAKREINRHPTIEDQCTASGNTLQETSHFKSTGTSKNPSRDPNISSDNSNNPLPTSSGLPTMAMFSDFSNVSFHGGNFVQNNMTSSDRPGFKLLQERVATSAFHNSVQRVDPPRCHPDTRTEILQRIYDWIIQSNDREKWLLWLNGAAGAGKSAIIQSTAERCTQAAIAIASFFFFRTDPTRNIIAPLIATLAYQLIQVIPETSDDILRTIEHNPLIFDQSVESQLQQLLIQPLLHLPTYLKRLFVIFIDGLDECNDRDHQSNLIKVLGNVSRSKNSPIVFVIASRRESQIEAIFVHKHISSQVVTLPLDNSDIEQRSDDIRRFLTDQFNEIKEAHLRKHLLPTDWPPESIVEEITSKSSGQFIYASVIVKYVSSPRTNPAHRLDIVRGIRSCDPSSHNPFAHLDALYQHIFSQVDALDKIFNILAYVLITEHRHVIDLEHIFLLEPGELEVYLSDLTALIECEPYTKSLPQINFLHASLPDFLKDKGRSERYHIDFDEYRTNLLCLLLDRVPKIRDPLSSTNTLNKVEMQEYMHLYAINELLKTKVKVSDRLQRSFMNFNFTTSLDSAMPIGILTSLKQLRFGDQGQAYYHVLEVLAVGFATGGQPLSNYVQENLKERSPDLLALILEILEEKA